MIKVSANSDKILKKYNIDYRKYNTLNDLLDDINDEMVSYRDKDDEPLPQFLELEKVYDEIYDLNI